MGIERSDIDILAGKSRTLKAGDETIVFREPVMEFYFEYADKIINVFSELYRADPRFLSKITGGNKMGMTDILRLFRARYLVAEFLSLLLGDETKDAKWFETKVSLPGLLLCLQAAIEVVDIERVRPLFFGFQERLRDAMPGAFEKITMELGLSSENSTSSPPDTEQTP